MIVRNSFPLLLALLLFHACVQSPTNVHPFTASPLDDGWPVSNPADQNLDPRILSEGYAAAEKLPYTYSLLVVRNGYLVAEQYFNGNRREKPNNIMSVSKSVLSGLVGISLREGFLDSLDQNALSFFPEYDSPSLDPRKHEITLRHLVTMRAGFDGDERTYFPVYNSSDWIKATLELPLLFTPGERMSYTAFGTHLLSAILTKSSDQSTLDIARTYLCEPLGISVHFWQQDPQGYYFGGNNMGLTPREMARFGYLYLKGGELNGSQIIPRRWVEESLTNYTNWQHLSWGDVNEYNYGYLWWLGEIRTHRVYFALGHGGQLIINVPQAGMIVVSTANPDFDWVTADEHERAIIHIIAKYILGSVKG